MQSITTVPHTNDDHEKPNIARMVESVLRCKWSWQVLGLIRNGIVRPGAMKRALPGMATKVQNDCLHRMLSFGIIQRTSFHELPPRVEYTLTPMGTKFVAILDAIQSLQNELIAASPVVGHDGV